MILRFNPKLCRRRLSSVSNTTFDLMQFDEKQKRVCVCVYVRVCLCACVYTLSEQEDVNRWELRQVKLQQGGLNEAVPASGLSTNQHCSPVSSHVSSYISLNLSFPLFSILSRSHLYSHSLSLSSAVPFLLTSLFYFSLLCFLSPLLSLQFLFSCVLFLSGRFHVSSSFSIVFFFDVSPDDVSFTAWFASFRLLSTYHFPCHFLFQCFSLSFLSCLISICFLIISLFLLCFLSHFLPNVLFFFMFAYPISCFL